MKLLVSAYIVVAFCAAASLQDASFEPCLDGPPPIDVRIKRCNVTDVSSCITAVVEFDFVAKNTTTLTLTIIAYILGKPIDVTPVDNNGCDYLVNLECPLKNGDVVTVRVNVPKLTDHEIYLVDDNKNKQVCFRIPGPELLN